MVYKASGVCSQEIHFEIDDNNTIHSVEFIGGCAGNGLGVARLVEGMKVDEAIARMSGIKCGDRSTSCPDQLTKALKHFVSKEKS